MDYSFVAKLMIHIGGRYILLAGLAFLFFYVWKKQRFTAQKIQNTYPQARDYRREVGFSLLTILIFALVTGLLLKHPEITPHTKRYYAISDKGWWWYFMAFPIMLFLHDSWFYFSHRLMHHPRLFKWFHRVHHRSTNPSPWAAYAFHPLEAMVEVTIVPIFLFSLPLHISHLVIFFLFMIAYNVYGHLGFEILPTKVRASKWGRWINSSTHHNQHHQYFKGNYSLYFLFWDKAFGTEKLRPTKAVRLPNPKRMLT
ncbi:MAG: sterol desaturase family protein [Bacteroidia bacterium]